MQLLSKISSNWYQFTTYIRADLEKSERALQVLAVWNTAASKFVKVMPKDYQRMLEAIQRAEQGGLAGDDAVMAAFEANKNAASRVSGN